MERAGERLGEPGEHPVAPRGKKLVWEAVALVALFIAAAGAGGTLYSMQQHQARLDRELLIALDHWDVEAMEQAVRDGATASKVGASGTSCAVLAATRPIPDLLREVLDRGAPVNPARPREPNPLFIAAQAGRAPQVRLLLERGAQVDATDAEGRTALMHATAASGAPEVLRLLLDAGARIDQADTKGQTALMWAIAWNDPVYVEFLRDAGADLTRRDRNGRTALDRARLKEKTARRRLANQFQTPGSFARMRRIITALSGGKKVAHPTPNTRRSE